MHILHYNHLCYLISCVYFRNELPSITENYYETVTFNEDESEVI